MSEKKSTRTGTIGADTSFLIDFFKGNEDAISFMRKNAKLLRVSELVIYEFLCGNLKKSEQEIFFDAMQSFTSVNFNREAAVLASEFFRNAKKKGKTIGHQDCMISGSYLASGIRIIVTKNTEHFKHLNEISVVSY